MTPPTETETAPAEADVATTQPDAPETEPTADANEPAPTGDEPADGEPTTDSSTSQETDDAGDDALAYDGIEVPDGTPLGENEIAATLTFARDNELPEGVAQALVQREHEQALAAMEDWDKTVKGWEQEVKNHAELGGENYTQTRTWGKAAIAQFAPEGMADFLNKSGYGNHPLFVQMTANVGKAMAEPGGLAHGGRTGDSSPESKARSLFSKSWKTMEAAARKNTGEA